jgi:hypothetical protein
MRRAWFVLVAIRALFASAHALAQTYDPSYPVCMQIYGPVGYINCRYTSLQQCRFLAVGRSATCVENPYFPSQKPAATPRSRRAN